MIMKRVKNKQTRIILRVKSQGIEEKNDKKGMRGKIPENRRGEQEEDAEGGGAREMIMKVVKKS